MAATEVVKTVLSLNKAVKMQDGATISAQDGALVAFDKADEKILIIFENTDQSDTKSAAIKAGNGIQGILDYTIALEAREKKCVSIESGRFVNVKGENKGKIFITGPADISVFAVVLP